jgi:hypothetical protein
VAKSCAQQLQPFEAVAEFPNVMIEVQLVEPEVVNLPAVAPPVVVPADSPYPALVVNLVPTDLKLAVLMVPVLSPPTPKTKILLTAKARVAANPIPGRKFNASRAIKGYLRNARYVSNYVGCTSMKACAHCPTEGIGRICRRTVRA